MDKKIRKGSRFSSAAATSNGSSSSKSVKNNSGGSKRKVLAELTNSLIPTEVLLDLCSNSISSSKAHDLLRRSQASTFPVSKSSQDSKVDSRSDTSIGSSSFNVVRDAQTPQLSNSSSVNLGSHSFCLWLYAYWLLLHILPVNLCIFLFPPVLFRVLSIERMTLGFFFFGCVCG